MTTSLETSNPYALTLLSEAVREIIAYRRDPRSIHRLDEASKKIRSALEKDPDYLRAIYYDALVDDLRFRAGDAPPKYERVLAAAKDDSPFFYEVRYNLGVAHYHRYHRDSLEKAVAEFDIVLANSDDPTLQRLTRAARAQALAMHMFPPKLDEPNLSSVADYSRRCRDDVRKALKGSLSARLRARSDRKSAVIAARWAAYNASGMRCMYLSDYWNRLDPHQRLATGEGRRQTATGLIQRAVKDLNTAEKERPFDWANWCDLGSAHMRLARVQKDAQHSENLFREAEKYLLRVVKVLRPNYGFALYELGRVYRLAKRFDEATEFLQQSLAIPKAERDVGDPKIHHELERAQARTTEFP